MIPKFSVKKPFTVAVGVIISFMLGIVSFSNMKTDLFPSIDLPFVMINTVYPGANPEKVETAVTKPLEQALATTTGLKNISSVSNENSSMVMLEFEEGINMDSAIIDINSKIDMVEGNFDESVSSPMIMKLNPDSMPIMTISADVEDMDEKEMTEYINNEILPEFERIEGVASVTASGLLENRLSITLNEDKIDDINAKMQSDIKSQFAEQENELANAGNEIDKSKDELESQLQNQIDEISKGLSEIKTGKEQLQIAVDKIGMTRDEIEDKIEDLKVQQIEMKIQIDTLKASIDKLPEEAAQALKEQLKLLEEGKVQIEKGIDGLNQAIDAMDGLAELEKQEIELVKAKSTLEQELSKATVELDNGKKEIEDAKTQIEDAKEGALESANLKEKITSEMIGGILQAQNFSMPAGYIEQSDKEYSLKVGDKFETVYELESLVLFDTGVEGIGEIKLSDVAEVEVKNNSDEIYTNINGNNGVIIAFQKASSYSTSEVSNSVHEAIENISKEDPKINLTTLMDQGVYIDMIVESVLSNLIYGGILAIIVLLFFLKNVSTTVVIAFSIPISVLFAIVMMYFSGITLNIISLSGLALGVGMLVDNSIVVLENIYRLRNEGMSKTKAAVEGARQVSGAIFASTLTTVCVFLPIIFTQGMTKELFMDMGLTIAYSLFASLAVALTVVPAMASTIKVNSTQKQGGLFDKFTDLYETILRKSLNHKAIVIIIALSLLGFSGFKAITMGTEFMPEVDSTQMTATLVVDDETTREEMLADSDEFVDLVKDIEDIEIVGAMDNSSSAMGGSKGISFYIVLKEDKKLSNIEISKQIEEKMKDKDFEVEIATSNMDMSALGGSGIQAKIVGSDIDELQRISKSLAKKLEGVEGVESVSNGLEDSNPEVRITINKNSAMEYGLTVAQVYQEISKDVKLETESTEVTLEGYDYPVVIENYSSVSKEELENYIIKGTKDNENVDVKLGDIAKIEETESLMSINRDNQSRYITVSATIDSEHNIGLVSRDVEDIVEGHDLPVGYSIEMAGENETIMESMVDLLFMGLMAVIFVYLIMVAQFQSLLSPFIVMFTIPLAITGGLLALIITGNNLSVVSMLGFLVLSGVVVNNGIVFVDYINQLRLEGMSKSEAIILTGRTRIRPILMTAMTTILAMFTMALGVGMGAEMSQGLAIVTIGGLLYGTVLTLVVIPVLYDLFHRKEIKRIVVDED